MKKLRIAAIVTIMLWLSGCSLHGAKTMEHESDIGSHQNSSTVM